MHQSFLQARAEHSNGTYPLLPEKAWLKPSHRRFKLACCDCGLIHNLSFRVRDGHVEMKIERNERATSAMRRQNNIKVKYVEQKKSKKLSRT